MLVLVIIGVVVALGLLVALLYNRMVARRNAVDNSWGQIDAALQRRHDLIPNLVEAVKGYAKHERETLEQVTKARGGAVAAHGTPQAAAAEGILGAALGKLLAVVENYPDLKASQNFLSLQEELANTESQIAITRRVYNDTVQTYNTLIQVFPAVLVANAFGFEARNFFDAPVEAEATPSVSFGGDDAGATPKATEAT